MKTIIAGSRTIHDVQAVVEAIRDSGFRITEVLCGMAPGVDRQGELWAARHSIRVRYFPANWEVLGRAAGPIRNALMAREADALILVWNGKSRGSASMLREARAAGLKIHEVVI